jgi:hypothetical protein
MGLWQFRMGLNGLAGDWEASHHRESDILNLEKTQISLDI